MSLESNDAHTSSAVAAARTAVLSQVRDSTRVFDCVRFNQRCDGGAASPSAAALSLS